jgi:hypothetical protein
LFSIQGIGAANLLLLCVLAFCCGYSFEDLDFMMQTLKKNGHFGIYLARSSDLPQRSEYIIISQNLAQERLRATDKFLTSRPTPQVLFVCCLQLGVENLSGIFALFNPFV